MSTLDPRVGLGALADLDEPVDRDLDRVDHRQATDALPAGDPRLRQQIRAQQLGQDMRVTLSSFNLAEAIALHCVGCTKCGSNP